MERFGVEITVNNYGDVLIDKDNIHRGMAAANLMKHYIHIKESPFDHNTVEDLRMLTQMIEASFKMDKCIVNADGTISTRAYEGEFVLK